MDGCGYLCNRNLPNPSQLLHSHCQQQKDRLTAPLFVGKTQQRPYQNSTLKAFMLVFESKTHFSGWIFCVGFHGKRDGEDGMEKREATQFLKINADYSYNR
jgi:hypothetical protein